MERIWKEIPQIELIENQELRQKVKKCFEEALKRSSFDEEQALNIPFTLLIPNCPVTLLQHTATVTDIAIASAKAMIKQYPELKINMDYLIAGAILHDVGKLLEYEYKEGEYKKSDFGKFVRHPISGAALALELGLPKEVAHIIATHSHEGDRGYRSPEAVILNKSDFIAFDTLRSFLGLTK